MEARHASAAAVARAPASPAPARGRFLEPAALALIALLPLAFFALFWNSPFERDEGVYATIADGLLEGKVPYRDLFDNKPPLVYGWYAFSFLLFGETVAAPRIIAAVLLSFTTLAIYAQTRLLFPRGVAYMAVAFFALSTGFPSVALHANTEAYMLLPMVASLLAFTMGVQRRRHWWFLLAGVLAGIALLTKQVAVWNLLALGVMGALWDWRANNAGWRSLLPATYLLAGAAVALFVAALPFALNGALSDFLYANVVYNYRYMGILSSVERVFILKRSLLFTLFFLALAAPLLIGAIAGAVTMFRVRKPWAYYAFAAWVVACALGVASGARFYPHYFLQLMPALAMLTAVFVYERLRNRRDQPVQLWAWLAVGLFVSVSLATNALLYLAPDTTHKTFSESAYQQKEWEEDSETLAAYVAARTDPQDRIFNYGRESQLYFYADRPPATAYFYDWAYFYDTSTIPKTVEELRRNPPEYIIDSVQPPLFEPSDRAPEIDRLLAERYEFVGRIEFADVYRLRDGP